MSATSSTKPDAWTLSPQMTAAPELWRNAMWAYCPAISNKGDILGQDDLDNFKSSNQIIASSGRAEDYVNTAGDHRQSANSLPVDTKALSVIMYLADPASADFGAVISNVPSSGSWSNKDSFAIQVMSNDNWRWICKLTNGEQRIDTPSATVLSGPQIIVGTRSKDGSQLKFYYNDTVDDTMDANSSSDIMLMEDPVIVGGYFDLTDSRFRTTHKHYYSVILHREVSAEEVEMLRADPWRPWRPAGF